jgi:hypothetical protein
VTLILTAITRRSVVMAADMRLVEYRTNKVRDDRACKMVLYAGRFVFAYTGPGCLDREPTGEWLARSLSLVGDPETIPEVLRERAEAAVRRYPWDRRALAIVGAGWTGSAEHPISTYFTIRNFDADDRLAVRFTSTRTVLEGPEKARLFSAGAAVPESLMRHMSDEITRRAGRRDERAGEFAAHLLRGVRSVALGNPTVGRSVLIGSLPGIHRAAGPPLFSQSVVMSLGAPDWRQPEFRVAPDRLDETVWWTPHLASPNSVTLSGQMRVDGPSDLRVPTDPCR